MRKVWSGFDVNLPTTSHGEVLSINFLPGLYCFSLKLSTEFLAVVAWAVWKKRCELLHLEPSSKMTAKPMSCNYFNWVLSMNEEYKSACLGDPREYKDYSLGQLGMVVKSMGDYLLVFTDASFYAYSGRYSSGIVVTNQNGDAIIWKRGEARRVEFPFEAEMWAILEGIKVARDRKGARVILVSDCMEAVNAINEDEVI